MEVVGEVGGVRGISDGGQHTWQAQSGETTDPGGCWGCGGKHQVCGNYGKLGPTEKVGWDTFGAPEGLLKGRMTAVAGAQGRQGG
eukprot:scaffold264430_cov37-Prasinocladus_malaysianus.AAC.1